MQRFLTYLFVILILSACASAKQELPETSEALEHIITSNNFEIKSHTAEPRLTFAMMQIANAGFLPVGSTPGRIDIIGISNFLKCRTNRVEANLPFFGERQIGAASGGETGGIEFDGVPESYEIKKGKKSGYVISFNIKDKNFNTESYSVNISLFPNLTSAISIRSTHRFDISYKGMIKPLKSE